MDAHWCCKAVERFSWLSRSLQFQQPFLLKLGSKAGGGTASGMPLVFLPCYRKMVGFLRHVDAVMMLCVWRFAMANWLMPHWDVFIWQFHQSFGGKMSSLLERPSCSSGRKNMWSAGA